MRSLVLVKVASACSPWIMHIVDELILERATRLQAFPPVWRMIRPFLYGLLGYDTARKMADAVGPKTGFEAFAHVSDQLQLNLNCQGLEHVPETGRAVVIGNHPTGLADGIAVFDALRARRPDLMFMANADALRVVPAGTDIIIPVEWVLEKRSREKTRATFQAFRRAMDEERCVVLFPSGTLAKLSFSGLVEKPWAGSAVSLARKYEAPIVPVHTTGINSFMYYLFCILNTELRDVTLFHELLNKGGKTFDLHFGTKIDPKTLPAKIDEATEFVRQVVTRQLAVIE
jgi:putative hemolysin